MPLLTGPLFWCWARQRGRAGPTAGCPPRSAAPAGPAWRLTTGPKPGWPSRPWCRYGQAIAGGGRRIPDHVLLDGFAVGDAHTGPAFVRRFQSPVYGMAINMLGDRGLAGEVTQEAFVRAWKHSATKSRTGRGLRTLRSELSWGQHDGTPRS